MGKESIHYIPVHSRDILIPNNLNTSIEAEEYLRTKFIRIQIRCAGLVMVCSLTKREFHIYHFIWMALIGLLVQLYTL